MSENKLTNITESQSLVSQELNNQVMAVLSNRVEGFEKAFVMSSAIQVLQERLAPEFMKPIMALQNSNLGFKTDKKEGYPESEVKACLIDAVLLGLQPTNNEFNIISGNMYPTRQGFGSLLKKIPGLKYSIIYSNPVFSQDKTSAICKATVSWEINNEKRSQELEFPIKSNSYASADAILGKAERKARRWLFNTVEGTDIPDGDITDLPSAEPKPTPQTASNEKERTRIQNHIDKHSPTVADLAKCSGAIKESDVELIDSFCRKHIELSTTLAELQSCAFGKYIAPEEDYDLFTLYSDKERELKNAK